MKIPISFKLAGETINVIYQKDLLEAQDALGEARYRRNLIALQPNIPEVLDKPGTKIEHSFCHELTHFILYFMEEESLRTNEKFVNLFSRYLHQALTTMEYE